MIKPEFDLNRIKICEHLSEDTARIYIDDVEIYAGPKAEVAKSLPAIKLLAGACVQTVGYLDGRRVRSVFMSLKGMREKL